MIEEIRNLEIDDIDVNLQTPKSIVDGSAFTTNPNVKYRRKRVITPSEETKRKRASFVQEFINYCKWRIGEIEICSNPHKIVKNVLTFYRTGKIEKIPAGYIEAIKCNRVLVDKAINVDKREILAKTKKLNAKLKYNEMIENEKSLPEKIKLTNISPTKSITHIKKDKKSSSVKSSKNVKAVKKENTNSLNLIDVIEKIKSLGVREFIIKF